MVVVNDCSVSSRQLSFVFRARLWINNFNDTIKEIFSIFPPDVSLNYLSIVRTDQIF